MATLMTREPATLHAVVVDGEFVEAALEQQYQGDVDATVEQRLLVSRVLDGDEEAFQAIVDQYTGLMLRTAFRIVKDWDVAEDAVQNAFIQAWQHLPNLREMGALRPWLMRIVVNQCISVQRKFTRSTQFLHQAFADEVTHQAALISDDAKGSMESNWDLVQVIGKLPMKQRMAITLHYYQGMTLPEMSQTLSLSENTLKKRIQAALINLRRMLKNSGHED